MTQKDKDAVIAALEEYKGDSTGLVAMTVEDCQRVVREMKVEDGWIPATERMPETGKVLCLTRYGHYKILEWLGTFNCWSDPYGMDYSNFKREYVACWMPLPKPPREVRE